MIDTVNSQSHTVFHVDVNSAFLSWSALKRLKEDPDAVDLRTIPSAVGGDVKTRHGIITAKSIPAKAFGIQTGEPVVKALQKCPHLVLVPSDFETYRAYSSALMKQLLGYTPLVQQASIDEAYLDVTEQVPSQNIKAAVHLADMIRKDIFLYLGFTVNVGISTNKLLAKMASDFRKPDMTHTLYPHEMSKKMWPLPIDSLYGCGKATADKLHSVGINTIGDAASADMEALQALLGERAGIYIHNSANGINTSSVNPEKEKAKSISNEITLSVDVSAENYTSAGIPVIRALSEKVASRLQKAGLLGQTVTLQVKTSDFQRFSRQIVLEKPVDKTVEIEHAALLLAERLLNSADGLLTSGCTIRLFGVGVSKLTEESSRQMDLFEWARENQFQEAARKKKRCKMEKDEKLHQMMCQINSRFGEGSLKKGSLDNQQKPY